MIKKILKIIPHTVFIGFLILLVIAQVAYHQTLSSIDNKTFKGVVTDKVCDSYNKCIIRVTWYDDKTSDLITLNKSDKAYGIADDYVYPVKLNIIEKLHILGPRLPMCDKFFKFRTWESNLIPVNLVTLFVLFWMALQPLIRKKSN